MSERNSFFIGITFFHCIDICIIHIFTSLNKLPKIVNCPILVYFDYLLTVARYVQSFVNAK